MTSHLVTALAQAQASLDRLEASQAALAARLTSPELRAALHAAVDALSSQATEYGLDSETGRRLVAHSREVRAMLERMPR